MLRKLGARVLGVPRTPGGYDLAALESLIVAHQPKAFFTQREAAEPDQLGDPVAQLFAATASTA